jgi:uncharacterized protein with GYD domain
MCRYLVLLNFTEKGVSAVNESIARAEDFKKTAERAGAKVEAVFWTVGPHDGAMILSAPDEVTAAGLVLGLGKSGSVRTCMMRAFDAGEFAQVVDKAV